LDFFSFNEWSEEDERIVGHPRDPFKRIDIRSSSRHVRIEVDGEVLADSSRTVRYSASRGEPAAISCCDRSS